MHKNTAAEMGKSEQIRDAKPQTGQMGVPGELWFFYQDTSLKIETPRKPWTDGHLNWRQLKLNEIYKYS